MRKSEKGSEKADSKRKKVGGWECGKVRKNPHSEIRLPVSLCLAPNAVCLEPVFYRFQPNDFLFFLYPLTFHLLPYYTFHILVLSVLIA